MENTVFLFTLKIISFQTLFATAMNSFSNGVNNIRKKNRKEPQEQNYKVKTC